MADATINARVYSGLRTFACLRGFIATTAWPLLAFESLAFTSRAFAGMYEWLFRC